MKLRFIINEWANYIPPVFLFSNLIFFIDFGMELLAVIF